MSRLIIFIFIFSIDILSLVFRLFFFYSKEKTLIFIVKEMFIKVETKEV